jgi:hypothetical protein
MTITAEDLVRWLTDIEQKISKSQRVKYQLSSDINLPKLETQGAIADSTKWEQAKAIRLVLKLIEQDFKMN